jgi:phosphoribosylformylglycinamidine (FGAM) synthase PurS component
MWVIFEILVLSVQVLDMEKDDEKQMVEALYRAIDSIQRLMNTIIESTSINDITDVYQVRG